MIKLDENNYLTYIDTPWDSKPLGLSTNTITKLIASTESSAEILLDTFEKTHKKIKYTSTRIDSRDIHIVKALGKKDYHMTEVVMKVTGVLSKLKVDKSLFSKFTFQQAKKEDYATIAKYAVKYFNHGKFHEDPLINRSIANTRNINMVEDLTKKYTTYVGKVGDNIIGFMILNHKDTVVDLLLGGMHIDYRHLSYAFWNRVYYEYKNKGVKKFITTISAANIPIVNLYSKFGFKFSQALYGFRKFR